MTRVYFVRHAQPEHNWKEDRTRPLTEEGKKDSEIVLDFFKDKKIDAFYCSPYKRSLDTIADTAAFFGKEIITDERFREREKGPGGNNHGMFQKRWADHDYHEEGGESIAMVQKRNIEALNEIISENTDKEIVVGTHGTALSTILNFYDNSFGCEDFLRIIDWMPYIVELDYEGDKLVGKQEHCHVEKEWRNMICKNCKLLLFDLDGTLLQSDKNISQRTLPALKKCREKGILIGVSTSRSEQNSLAYLNELMPDILISSGGALVKYKCKYIYKAEFSVDETNAMIDMARNVCGKDCEITIDTIDAHYWNYKVDPKKIDKSWGDSIYTDFSNFAECSLKMCVEIFEPDKAVWLAERLSDCDCVRFSDGYWYKFTKKNVTKENAIMKITEVCGFDTDSIIAFGDDYADIGMLKLCGTGVAMGNAIDEVKEKADIVIGSNDEDGIAEFIEKKII